MSSSYSRPNYLLLASLRVPADVGPYLSTFRARQTSHKLHWKCEGNRTASLEMLTARPQRQTSAWLRPLDYHDPQNRKPKTRLPPVLLLIHIRFSLSATRFLNIKRKACRCLAGGMHLYLLAFPGIDHQIIGILRKCLVK